MADAAKQPGPRPASEIPRPGLLQALKMIASGGGGRVDMLTPLRRLHVQYGPVVMQKADTFRMVNLFGPDANRFVLVDQERIFSAKKPWDMIMGRIFPNGLLLRDGDDHKHHRKIMHTAFTRPALRTYAARMGPMIDTHLASWGERGGSLRSDRQRRRRELVEQDAGPAVDDGVGEPARAVRDR